MATFGEWVGSARRLLSADGGQLWGMSLAETAWLAIDGDRLVATEDPNVAGFAPSAEGLWIGPKPPEFVGNTAVDWVGRRWAMCVLPLDPDEALRLLVHEAWHAIQPQLLPGLDPGEMSPGQDIFDTIEGRVWLRVELSALVSALTSSAGRQRRAAAAALAFRRRRDALARREEQRRERALDLFEGLPEYTGWRLTGATSSDLADRVAAPPPVSWSRSFCYRTGPAYAYLLDDLVPNWRRQLDSVRDLQALLAPAVGDDLDPDAEAVVYGIEAIRAEETASQVAIDAIKERFATRERLRIRPGSAGMRIGFDPRRVWGSDEGTIYGSFTWSDGLGTRLAADRGALVTSDWKEIWVPLGDARVGRGLTEGDGWTLELSPAWRAHSDGGSVLVEPAS